MSSLRFPPPPEFGWYEDDVESSAVAVESVTGESSYDGFAAGGRQSASAPVATDESDKLEDDRTSVRNIADARGDVSDEDWDGTVLSSSFTMKEPSKSYRLYNEATGQDVTITCSVLLGRHPSATVPEGAKSVRFNDPTRTMSRNHAAVSIDRDGTLWIEDYGSLNGTYVIHDETETQVSQGTPIELEVPAVIRMGDQFIQCTEVG
ncbi:FHA domain-containing protein [Bifidobacterium bombi]|uniref:FHA domain-containing protein n=1 Tax=Bifidobacterium bombi DSM 19703 TaxID=1341695 RepID=A0A080N2T8_9BIFI|nr:FHA domain-containing protein [Bifidobacterium bombi]KFF31358.1 FHA domain-containing protein [Bifidobacterium bombi DSM 19703]